MCMEVVNVRVCTCGVCVCVMGISRHPDAVTDMENRLCSGDFVSHILTHFARDFCVRRVGHLSASGYISVRCASVKFVYICGGWYILFCVMPLY